MSLQFTITPEDKFIRSVASGTNTTVVEMHGYLLALAEAAIQHQATHVLCDESSINHDIGIAESYQLAEQMAQLGHFSIRVAIICNAYTIERGRFLENAAVNRGMMLKVCLTNEEAEQWLFRT